MTSSRDGANIKVRYKGYSAHFYEWKMKDDIVLSQPESPDYINPITVS